MKEASLLQISCAACRHHRQPGRGQGRAAPQGAAPRRRRYRWGRRDKARLPSRLATPLADTLRLGDASPVGSAGYYTKDGDTRAATGVGEAISGAGRRTRARTHLAASATCLATCRNGMLLSRHIRCGGVRSSPRLSRSRLIRKKFSGNVRLFRLPVRLGPITTERFPLARRFPAQREVGALSPKSEDWGARTRGAERAYSAKGAGDALQRRHRHLRVEPQSHARRRRTNDASGERRRLRCKVVAEAATPLYPARVSSTRSRAADQHDASNSAGLARPRGHSRSCCARPTRPRARNSCEPL